MSLHGYLELACRPSAGCIVLLVAFGSPHSGGSAATQPIRRSTAPWIGLPEGLQRQVGTHSATPVRKGLPSHPATPPTILHVSAARLTSTFRPVRPRKAPADPATTAQAMSPPYTPIALETERILGRKAAVGSMCDQHLPRDSG